MDIRRDIERLIPKFDSPERIYELFRVLGYPGDKVLDPSYKRKIEEFEFAREEQEKVKDIYTIFNYDGKLQAFFIETRSLSAPHVRYLVKSLSNRYLRFLLILTSDYREYAFVFPEFERLEEGRHKLKLTKLIFDRENPYHSDILTISSVALTGEEENWRDIWKKWRDAFSVRKVTEEFFVDYKGSFFELRNTFEAQGIQVKNAHELSQQFLNRLMFLYFISKKKWLNNDSKFIKWYWERYKEEKRNGTAREDTFYEKWLESLFLEAFNNKYPHHAHHPPDIRRILADAPYLNGGLFRRNDLDNLSFHISDSLFGKIICFFEKYHFTIREDLTLDVEVAVDPQMIGYVYESLSNVAEEIYERQDLGIFYTPTVEVDFMCRRSLVEYLSNHISLQKEWIYRLLFDEDKKAVAEHISELKLWYRLEELLDNVAVVDPACGSGAFLVGMLNVLAELYRFIFNHIEREMSEFELKKKIIGSFLYGVDVMPWAVHSAELRLWLQLIIEEDIPYEQRKIFPLLPNLNLKLRAGDSLVQEIGGINLHVRDEKLSSPLKRKLTSLKQEKEKFYNNDPTGKFKSTEALLHEELRIFSEILEDKAISIQKDIQNMGGKRLFQKDLYEGSKQTAKQISIFEGRIKAKRQEIEQLQETKRKILSPGQKPFVWDIDFTEIFGDKGGFDIVIGNPPYVRQEKIAPPNRIKAEVSLEDKREYKDKLLKSIQVHYPFVKKLDKKSDYYIYFYFHGLSLLNDKGIFCFITSNSWLDVGYGKDLQEFLLKYCHVKAIYDNEAKRSFEHADVNTIIALFGPPKTGRASAVWPALKETARFVMFKKPFEEVINAKNLLDMERAGAVQKTESYRVYPVKQETLFEEGWEGPEEDNVGAGLVPATKKRQPQGLPLQEKFIAGKYEGNKWGGKYLRAPDIFFTILEKGEGKLVRLGDIAEVRRGFTSGVNEFFYLVDEKIKNWQIEKEFLKPVIKSPKDCKSILIKPENLKTKVFICHKSKKELKGKNALKYIEWGEKQGFDKRKTVKNRTYWWDLGDHKIPAFTIIKGPWLRHFVPINGANAYCDQQIYEVLINEKFDSHKMGLFANTTLSALFFELEGRSNFGEGILWLSVYEAANLLVIDPRIENKLPQRAEEIKERKIGEIFTELGFNPAIPIREQKPNPLPDRKALDDVVFDILGLTEDERNEVYWSVCELVKNRLSKARSM